MYNIHCSVQSKETDVVLAIIYDITSFFVDLMSPTDT